MSHKDMKDESLHEGSSKDKKTRVYYGETHCQKSVEATAKACPNKAYYIQGGRYVCGVHSSVDKRKKLPKNPDADLIRATRIKDHQASVEAATKKNKAEGKIGDVKCGKMGMMRRPDDIEGHLKVFPNFKHQNRKDGFGCAALSPMSLGPVNHKQKDIPICKLLENYHQYNKVYQVELQNGEPGKGFRKLRLEGYKSKTPQRHKTPAKRSANSDVDPKKTAFSVHSDDKGMERRYNYVQSRYFYCHFYEELSKDVKDLGKLKRMRQNGVNLHICGFDGYDVTKPLMTHYCDPGKPFGHEMVIYTLLTVDDPKKYPWNVYYEEHKGIYPLCLAPSYKAEDDNKTNEESQLANPKEEEESKESASDDASDSE